MQNPGLKRGQIASRLKTNRGWVESALTTLEHNGYLIYQDEHRLYAYGHTSERSIMTVADYLVKGMNLPPLEKPPKNGDRDFILLGTNVHYAFIQFVLDHSNPVSLMAKRELSEGSKKFDPES